MPGFDRTGPHGQGRMSGRRMGRCTNFGAAIKKADEEVNEKPAENPPENIPGPGFKRGRGFRGFGQGQQHRFGGGAQ